MCLVDSRHDEIRWLKHFYGFSARFSIQFSFVALKSIHIDLHAFTLSFLDFSFFFPSFYYYHFASFHFVRLYIQNMNLCGPIFFQSVNEPAGKNPLIFKTWQTISYLLDINWRFYSRHWDLYLIWFNQIELILQITKKYALLLPFSFDCFVHSYVCSYHGTSFLFACFCSLVHCHVTDKKYNNCDEKRQKKLNESSCPPSMLHWLFLPISRHTFQPYLKNKFIILSFHSLYMEKNNWNIVHNRMLFVVASAIKKIVYFKKI